MNKTAKIISTGVLLCLLLLGISCGIAGASGYVNINYISEEVQPGGSLTIGGTVYSDITYKPYEFYVLIIGDSYWYYRYYTQNQTGDSNFKVVIDDLGNIPVGEYYVILVTPSDGDYEVYPEDPYLYYKGTAVENLNDLKGLNGAKTVIDYLSKSDVNDVYSAGTFWVVNPTKTTTPDTTTPDTTTPDTAVQDIVNNKKAIVGTIKIVITALIVIAFVSGAIIKSRKRKANEAKHEVALRETPAVSNQETVLTEKEPETKTKTEEFVYCPYCGEKLEKDAKFCMKCGKEIPK